MTRKRFIKLLMASGYSRNGAQVIAWEQVENCRSYADAYRAHSSVKRLADAIGPELVAALNSATDAIMRFARAVCVGMSAFSEAFSKSMSMGGRA